MGCQNKVARIRSSWAKLCWDRTSRRTGVILDVGHATSRIYLPFVIKVFIEDYKKGFVMEKKN